MIRNNLVIEREFSIKRMLRLAAPDNIFIGRLDFIWKYREMLLERLSGMDLTGVKIHLCPPLITTDIDRYEQINQRGADVTLWAHTSVRTKVQSQNLRVVHVKPNTRKLEGFLLIRTPASSRMLAAWQDIDSRVRGVLITNPRSVEKLADRLEAIYMPAINK